MSLLDAPASPPQACRVVLRRGKVRPFFGRHPWVLDGAVQRVEGQPADGDVVDLHSDRGQFIARGLYNSRSRLRVRLYTWDPRQPLDAELWRRRIDAALALRAALGLQQPAGAVRLVNSEGDGLGGLVVDRYAEHLVVQVTAQGIAHRLGEIVPALVQLLHPRSILLRTDREMNKAEGLHLEEGPLWGTPPEGPVFVEEHGLKYGVDLAAGQKTGLFLDQRDNRRAAAEHVRGRRVLDVCCYSGGFSLAAAALGGARHVLGIDSSSKAIALARANAELNGLSHVQFEVADAFHKLQALVTQGERFGAVVLDPPKFARHRLALADALKAYHHLNRLAVEALLPEGLLVTCSCSGHVSREQFAYMLADVAQRTGRDVQILQQRGAAPDHPISASCLEGEYLKCFVCRVL